MRDSTRVSLVSPRHGAKYSGDCRALSIFAKWMHHKKVKTLAFTLILGITFLTSFTPAGAASLQCSAGIQVDIEGAPSGFKIFQKGDLTWVRMGDEFLTSDAEVLSFCKEAKLYPKNPERIVVLSSTYLPWLEDLGLLEHIVGISSKSYVANEKIHQLVEAKKIVEVGLPASAERILGLRPDLVITYKPIDREIEGLDQLASLGLNVLELSEFREGRPLGRGAWIVFMAAVLGNKEQFQKARELWGQRYSNYQNYKDAVKNLSPTNVIVGNMAENAWTAPLSKSDLAQLIEDARGEYLWKSGTGENLRGHALNISFEKVLQTSSGARVWLTQNQWSTLREAYQEDSRYKLLMSTHRMDVYNYSKGKKAGRGFDYWESGIARPDLLLRDLILILHSKDKSLDKIFKNKDTKWYQKLD